MERDLTLFLRNCNSDNFGNQSNLSWVIVTVIYTNNKVENKCVISHSE